MKPLLIFTLVGLGLLTLIVSIYIATTNLIKDKHAVNTQTSCCSNHCNVQPNHTGNGVLNGNIYF